MMFHNVETCVWGWFWFSAKRFYKEVYFENLLVILNNLFTSGVNTFFCGIFSWESHMLCQPCLICMFVNIHPFCQNDVRTTTYMNIYVPLCTYHYNRQRWLLEIRHKRYLQRKIVCPTTIRRMKCIEMQSNWYWWVLPGVKIALPAKWHFCQG